MIIGITKPNTIHGLLSESQFRFYLTGSRYFGSTTSTSDWDFFVADTPEVTNWLTNNGFSLVEGAYNNDPNITTVYAKDDYHIQLVADVKNKLYSQIAIAEFLSSAGLKPNKALLKALWAFASKLTTHTINI